MFRKFGLLQQSFAKVYFPASIRFKSSEASFPFKTEYLEIAESAQNGPARKLAYTQINGDSTNQPGVLYVPGFMATGTAVKAQEFLQLCQKNHIPCVTYDPSGLGRSRGSSMPLAECRFGHWLVDVEQILTRLTKGPHVLVGSSMGCWLSCILAQRFPDTVKALLFIAPGINFAEQYHEAIFSMLPKEVIKTLEDGGVFDYYNPDYGTMPVTLGLFNSMREHNLPTEPKSLNVTCPVRMIHSLQDKDVPYKAVLRLLKSFAGTDAHLTYLNSGKHQLHEPHNLAIMTEALLKLRKHAVFTS